VATIEAILEVGCSIVVTWLVAHFYYRRSVTNAPNWARPLIERLPDTPPTPERLMDLYQQALMDGQIERPDPMTGLYKCPRCGAPASQFKGQTYESDYVTGVQIKCPSCGYSESIDT